MDTFCYSDVDGEKQYKIQKGVKKGDDVTRFLVQLKEFGPKGKMTYQLEIKFVIEDDLEVVHAQDHLVLRQKRKAHRHCLWHR